MDLEEKKCAVSRTKVAASLIRAIIVDSSIHAAAGKLLACAPCIPASTKCRASVHPMLHLLNIALQTISLITSKDKQTYQTSEYETILCSFLNLKLHFREKCQ